MTKGVFRDMTRVCVTWAQESQMRPFERYEKVIYRMADEISIPALAEEANITPDAARRAVLNAVNYGILERAGERKGKARRFVVYRKKSNKALK